ncbi:unnamed protein product [Dibothriocephalus latus]|uniref:Uncharacterized protein n=1 Tax=Dibothriocephalus latus TaxID=60516 RepID=A0A3P7PJJ3_DIBLA|nr:unnamed protein product [Dibothriocephalus latus]
MAAIQLHCEDIRAQLSAFALITVMGLLVYNIPEPAASGVFDPNNAYQTNASPASGSAPSHDLTGNEQEPVSVTDLECPCSGCYEFSIMQADSLQGV